MSYTLQEILLLEERVLAAQAQRRRAEAAASEEKLLERRAERARRMLAEAGVSVPAASSGPVASVPPTTAASAGPDQAAWKAAATRLATQACKTTAKQESGVAEGKARAGAAEASARCQRMAAFITLIRDQGTQKAFANRVLVEQYNADAAAERADQEATQQVNSEAAEAWRRRVEGYAERIRKEGLEAVLANSDLRAQNRARFR